MLQSELDRLFTKESKKLKTLQFAMSVSDLDLYYDFSSTKPNQIFHSASVGKMMASTLIFIGIERGLITLDTKISSILSQEILSDLFVYDGEDYKEKVTVKELLGHTSGVNDYYESKTMTGSKFIDEILVKPNKFWTPMELLDFTRKRQQAVGKPSEKFLYSDTGYILIGLILEKIFKLPYNVILEENIFKPLGMKSSGLSFYSEDFNRELLAPMYINGIDVHNIESLSCDFSGGGIYTNTEDLIKF